MSPPKKNALIDVGGATPYDITEGDQEFTNTYEGASLMSIVTPINVETNPGICPAFNTGMSVNVRAASCPILLDTEHIEWLGRTLVKIEAPGYTLHLDAHEARDLADNLRDLALYIEEEAAR